MYEITKGGSHFVGYEYKERSVPSDKASLFLDGYASFGWIADPNIAPVKTGAQMQIKLKRNRKILNKAELTRLQRNFEACMDEIDVLEKSKTATATRIAVMIGITGTVFMALSTFAVTHEPPLILLCVLFAIPGISGWGLPHFVYREFVKRRTAQVIPLLEQIYDEIYEICEKGNHLLLK